MKTTKELLELLKFTANQKANEATKSRFEVMNTIRDTNNIEPEKLKKLSYAKGQYMAFNEFYSLLCNLEKHI